MLNNGTVLFTEGIGVQSGIVVTSMPSRRVSCRVDKSIANGTDGFGRPLILAGTPLNGDLEDRQVPMTLATSGTPTGVLINDIPAYENLGDAINGSLLIEGTIIREELDEAVSDLIDATDIPGNLGDVKIITRK